MENHKGQGVTWKGGSFGIIDIGSLGPIFDIHNKGTDTPIHLQVQNEKKLGTVKENCDFNKSMENSWLRGLTTIASWKIANLSQKYFDSSKISTVFRAFGSRGAGGSIAPPLLPKVDQN